MEELLEATMQEEDEYEEADIRQGKYMTFQIEQDVYGIELRYVDEIIQQPPITPIPEVEPFIKGLINLRGKIIPVIDVAERFNKQSLEYNDRTCVIVIEIKGIEVGLVIGNIAEVVSIEENDIQPPPNVHNTAAHNKFIHGIGKVDGEIKLLLDPIKLLSDDALDFIDKQEMEEEE